MIFSFTYSERMANSSDLDDRKRQQYVADEQDPGQEKPLNHGEDNNQHGDRGEDGLFIHDLKGTTGGYPY